MKRKTKHHTSKCDSCLKPIEPGHVVLPWRDAGEMHADCDNPFSVFVRRQEDSPAPRILVDNKLYSIPLTALEPYIPKLKATPVLPCVFSPNHEHLVTAASDRRCEYCNLYI